MSIFDGIGKRWQSGRNDDERLSPVEESLRAELGKRIAATAADPAGATAPVRYRLRWTGLVQGVGFRWTNQNLAAANGLTGWVKNIPDGSVDMEVQGAPASVLHHLQALHAQYAQFSSRIWLDEALNIPIVLDESKFEVHY